MSTRVKTINNRDADRYVRVSYNTDVNVKVLHLDVENLLNQEYISIDLTPAKARDLSTFLLAFADSKQKKVSV